MSKRPKRILVELSYTLKALERPQIQALIFIKIVMASGYHPWLRIRGKGETAGEMGGAG
jgi:hypothetical protein